MPTYTGTAVTAPGNKTFASATLALARILMDVTESTATGGSTTTIVDTSRTERADYYDGGTLWFLSGNNAGKVTTITDWTLTTHTFTHPTQSAANAAGVKYACAPGTNAFPLYVLKASINTALATIGSLPERDTSLTTVEDQEAYSLPSGVYDVRRVEVAQETAAPYEYQRHYNWQVIDGYLVFDTGHVPDESGYTIRLTHVPAVTELDADTDTIPDYIHADRVKWEAAVQALRWQLQRVRQNDPLVSTLLNEAIANANREAVRYPVPTVQPDPHLGKW